MTTDRITFELTYEDDVWMVRCPQINGFKTHGPTIDEALEMAVSLLQELKHMDSDPDPKWHHWLGPFAAAVTNGTRVTLVTQPTHGVIKGITSDWKFTSGK